MNNPWQNSMKKSHHEISEWLTESQKAFTDIELPKLSKEEAGACLGLLADLDELLEKANDSFWIGFGLLNAAYSKLWDIAEQKAAIKEKEKK